MMASPSFFINDALYCSEGETSFFNEMEEEFRPVVLEQDLYWEDDEQISLVSKQVQNQLSEKLESDPFLAEARARAVDWMLRVNAHYSFGVLTAILAVNFLDRFLFSFHLQTEKPWMTQLAAVACLSLAAKVEETQVPLLLDLQVEDSEYVFEAKTVQRMELLVLSTLQWRMNPVTPLSFLDYFTRRLGFKDWEFIMRCECTVLSLIADCRSVSYLPSVIATATMLHVINAINPNLEAQYESQMSGILGIDKEKLKDCRELIMELGSSCYYYSSQLNKRKFGSVPGSPNCVMDVSFSSDCSNDSWAIGSSVSSSPVMRPPAKKVRGLSGVIYENEETFLGIHR